MKTKQMEERVSILLGSIIVRIFYFIVGFFLPIGVLFSFGRRMAQGLRWFDYGNWSPMFAWGLLALCLASAILSALFGPAIYEATFHRGRGSLQEVKKASEGKNQGYRKY